MVVAAVVLSGVLLVTAVNSRTAAADLGQSIPHEMTHYGVDPIGRDWAQTQVRYLGFAFLYVIFAVDAVYLFPWALVARTELGVASFVEVGIFVGIVLIGLAHAVRRGLLRWL